MARGYSSKHLRKSIVSLVSKLSYLEYCSTLVYYSNTNSSTISILKSRIALARRNLEQAEELASKIGCKRPSRYHPTGVPKITHPRAS